MNLHIFLSHPIQHFVPWLQKLHERSGSRLVVHYASRHGLESRHDPEFGTSFAWEMDLLSGYRHEFWEDRGVVRGPGHGFWGIRYPGLDAYLRRSKPDAVLVWGWLYAGYWHAAMVANKLGIPYFLRGESNLLNQNNPLRFWLKQQTVGRLCREAAGCLAIGSRNAKLYQTYGVKSSQIWTVPYFVDNAWFESESVRLMPERILLRRKFGLPEDALVFLFMGKLIEKKHPEHLLKAWLALPDTCRDRSALLVVGSGEMAESLSRRAANEPRIRFAGFLNRRELPEAYAASDVLALPSDAGETWGLVVNEAMASGLPAIVSDQVGCSPDLVRDGETGFIFPFGDQDELTCHLHWCINNSAVVPQLGAAARSHIGLASVEKATEATLQALESLEQNCAYTTSI